MLNYITLRGCLDMIGRDWVIHETGGTEPNGAPTLLLAAVPRWLPGVEPKKIVGKLRSYEVEQTQVQDGKTVKVKVMEEPTQSWDQSQIEAPLDSAEWHMLKTQKLEIVPMEDRGDIMGWVSLKLPQGNYYRYKQPY